MKKRKKIISSLLLGTALFFYGCASAVSPYKGEFECPQKENGKCVGIPQAYVESLKESENATLTDYYPTLEEKKVLNQEIPEEQKIYADALFNKLTKVLKDPETPFLVSPQVVRILILPYKDDGGKTLFFSRYVYVITDEPRWVFDNLLTEKAENDK